MQCKAAAQPRQGATRGASCEERRPPPPPRGRPAPPRPAHLYPAMLAMELSESNIWARLMVRGMQSMPMAVTRRSASAATRSWLRAGWMWLIRLRGGKGGCGRAPKQAGGQRTGGGGMHACMHAWDRWHRCRWHTAIGSAAASSTLKPSPAQVKSRCATWCPTGRKHGGQHRADARDPKPAQQLSNVLSASAHACPPPLPSAHMAPALSCMASSSAGGRTLSTRSAPRADALSTSVAPAAW